MGDAEGTARGRVGRDCAPPSRSTFEVCVWGGKVGWAERVADWGCCLTREEVGVKDVMAGLERVFDGWEWGTGVEALRDGGEGGAGRWVDVREGC